MAASQLPTGLVAFVKKDCPTCLLIEPVLHELARTQSLTIYSQDDPQFPAGLPVASDLRLDVSYREKIEIEFLVKITNLTNAIVFVDS